MATPVTDTTIESKAPLDTRPDAAPNAGTLNVQSPDAPTPDASEPKSPRGRKARAMADGGAAAEPGSPPPLELDPASIAASIEAILLSCDRPVAPARLGEALAPAPVHKAGGPRTVSAASIRAAVELLNEAYGREGRSFRIETVSGGLRIMTRPEHAQTLARFHGQRASTRLSRAALESLAIIAYRQPITRAEIEAIRGVATGDIVKALMERRLVTITGRAEELGRPMLYGTTKQFLEAFGLASLKDLPPPEEFGLGPVTPSPVLPTGPADPAPAAA